MTREDEYRKYAADMVEMAQRVSLSSDKGRLLAMAEAWLNLADRTQEVARRHATKLREHPLIKTKFGRSPDA
jgi:hypothetical protein